MYFYRVCFGNYDNEYLTISTFCLMCFSNFLNHRKNSLQKVTVHEYIRNILLSLLK